MSNVRNGLLPSEGPRCSPAAIRACVSALASEALEAGHPRVALALASVAELLSQPELWEPSCAAPEPGSRAI